MSNTEDQINYMKKHLISTIVQNLGGQYKILNYDIKSSNGLDGFMSTIFRVQLEVEDDKARRNAHNIIVKFMKGDKSFRELSKSYKQFANEIFIYSKVLPYYQKCCSESGSSIVIDDVVPRVYFSKYGNIEGLESDSDESVLAMKDLSPKGYCSGPRLCLDRQHVLLMMEPLAKYHSMTYFMRIRNDEKLNEFINEIIPLSWTTTDENEQKNNFYYPIYRAAFDRFFLYYDKNKTNIIKELSEECERNNFIENIERLRKYQSDPTKLLEKFREIDETFSVILHGDYNRNNVLFKYDNNEKYDDPKDIKMIDFQELRYGTPAIDLSFFMYMNTDPSIRDNVWMELLEYYHKIIMKTLSEILKVDLNSDELKPYSFENFNKHFVKFGLYGALVCMHFLPWMYANEDECQQLSDLFAKDVNGEAFYKLSIEAAGNKVDEVITNILKHASRMGYMDYIL